MAAVSTLNETLRTIDESIAKRETIGKLLAPLLALRSRRNDLVPISQLPPEIMCRIFFLAQVPHSFAYKPNPLEWITLTYVCRHWRNIAVNSPSLWISPPIGNRKWVEEMLRRSKESGLIIKSNTDTIDSGLVSALQQIHRIRELSLRAFSSDEWNVLREMFPKSVPQLERLCLEGLDSDMGYGPDGPGPLIIPEDILCETGRLRQLELKNCELNWNSQSHLLRSLTHLKLYSLPPNSLPTGKQLINALKGIPELEALTLWNSLPTQTEQRSSWGSENIHIAHLRTLSINSVFVEVETFFRRVSFPPAAIVKLVCHDDGDYLDFSGAIFALGRSYSNTTPDTAFHSIIQREATNDGTRLMLFTEAFKISEIMSTNVIAHLDLTLFCGDTASPATRKVMTDFFNSGIPLHDINCVYLPENLPNLKSETIANTYGMLPQLRSVMAAGNGATSFFNAMYLGSHVGDAAGPGEAPIQVPYFPCVSSIGIYRTTFVEADMLEDPEYSDALSVELLQNFFIQRCELRVPIETLLLRDCVGVFDEDVKLLEEIVVNVDCDVYEDISNGNSEDEEEGEGETEEDEGEGGESADEEMEDVDDSSEDDSD